MRRRTPLAFTVGHAQTRDAIPDTFIPAAVPGAVQLDWAAAHDAPPYWYGDNFKDYAWMEDVYWRYRAELPDVGPFESVFLVCGGVDYQYEVFVDGESRYAHEGMFTAFELDLTKGYKPGALLEIRVDPAPKSTRESVDRVQANQSVKPAVSYGWDWHPRLIPLGIWEETYIEVRPCAHIHAAETRYALSAERDHAVLRVDAKLSKAEGTLRWTLLAPDGTQALTQTLPAQAEITRIDARLDDPLLWWPNGHGAQALYTSRVELLAADGSVLDAKASRIGFRSLELVPHPGAWEQPADFPKTRSDPPITLRVNGRTIFGKGTNWVNPDIFPGRISAELYRAQVQYAKDAHMNLFRIWGGGIVNKDSFFDACDEMGILVWQEFPLACNNYEGTPSYLKVLDAESRAIIRRLRHRASLAIWCGGNELFNGWSGMTEQSLALRLLNRNCYDLDPGRPFLYTSPLMNMAHGCYLFRYPDGREVYQVMPASSYTAYTEFGVPSPSSEELLRSFLPPDQVFPPKPGTSWETHHAYGAWDGGGQDTWLCQGIMEDYFGKAASVSDLVKWGQWMQCEGYRCIYEEARRQKPKCAMAVNWCYQEPWPTAANNNLISWPNTPKPALAAVGLSCRPQLVSARIPKFSWKPGERFTAEIWLLNDAYAAIEGCRVEAEIELNGKRIPLLTWDAPAAPENENIQGPSVSAMLPEACTERIKLVLRVVGRPEMDSTYTLHYRT